MPISCVTSRSQAVGPCAIPPATPHFNGAQSGLGCCCHTVARHSSSPRFANDPPAQQMVEPEPRGQIPLQEMGWSARSVRTNRPSGRGGQSLAAALYTKCGISSRPCVWASRPLTNTSPIFRNKPVRKEKRQAANAGAALKSTSMRRRGWPTDALRVGFPRGKFALRKYRASNSKLNISQESPFTGRADATWQLIPIGVESLLSKKLAPELAARLAFAPVSSSRPDINWPSAMSGPHAAACIVGLLHWLLSSGA
ncbi:hypothetical protein QBC47DRAFT_112008 [Echria macrotheca]|uniref:Uncharacterized protein n=1 Tax=Echria macrotheca TaxID=438768 RepID=A0AAJ0FG02_9PEZI|nr:hypothetical protein QBC47DRAFT_112008 [Echria macrotheca]